MFEVPKK